MSQARIIITGQSGVRIKKSIDGFVKNATPFMQGGALCKPFYLEEAMTDLYCESEGRPRYDTIWMDEILNLPARRLQCLWDKAFGSTLQRMASEDNQAQSIILSFHACFYHQSTVEYLCCVREALVQKFKPDVFVTFIDDAYDVHTRLREPEQMFSGSFAGAQDPVGCVFELLRILDWRANEIMMTRHIAEAVGKRHYVLAVKHSYDTLYKLAYGEAPSFYISHPISEVRRLEEKKEVKQATAISKEIHRKEMSKNFPCFLPTTIDELRIRRQEKKDGDRYVPELLERWDAKKYDQPTALLYVPPNVVVNPLWGSTQKISDDFNLILRVLHENIGFQVSSRDYKLVQQADMLAVYRPCFNGNPSGGIRREIDYYLQVADHENKRCFIYVPRKDQLLLKFRQLEKAIRNEIKNARIEYKGKEEFCFSKDEQELLFSVFENGDMMKVLRGIIDGRQGMRVDASKPHGVGADAAQEATRIITEIVDRNRETCETILRAYSNAATKLWDEDDWTPEKFVGSIVQFLSEGVECE